jgi:hypothetical protein
LGTSSNGDGEDVSGVVLCINGDHLVDGEPVSELVQHQGLTAAASLEILDDPLLQMGSPAQHGCGMVREPDWYLYPTFAFHER